MLSASFNDLKQIADQYKGQYQRAEPFPNIYFDNFFNEDFLARMAAEFPDLAQGKKASYSSPTELKLAFEGWENLHVQLKL